MQYPAPAPYGPTRVSPGKRGDQAEQKRQRSAINYSRTVLYLKWTPKAWRCIYLAARPLYWDQTVGTCDTVYTAYAVQL
jgi:hypothetical protein